MLDVLGDFCKKLISDDLSIEDAKNEAKRNFDFIYPESINELDDNLFFMVRFRSDKKLVIIEKNPTDAIKDFNEEKVVKIEGKKIKINSLNHANAAALRKVFPYTNPVAFGKKGISMGLGDRLGLASPGHLRLIKNTDIKPVLAQQSIRELDLTHRTYQDILDSASWAVFQEGYKKGFGADGDHLKIEDDVKMALDLGFTMITLDCSEKINNDVPSMSHEDVEKAYNNLEKDYTEKVEKDYLGKEFVIGESKISYDKKTLQQIVLIYCDALEFTRHIFFDIVKPTGKAIDFELSIDETQTPTSPEAHFFVASELEKMGVEVNSVAPRFCGEFQKGIDYIGDLEQFEKEFKAHSDIADNFGYKLSIHSGSDKFKVFPIIGKYTNGRVHVKTAGTNWLEAMRIIALKAPALFRKIYVFAQEHFDEATKYYQVTTDLTKIPDITNMKDKELPEVLSQDDARQVLHITYGIILTSKDDENNYIFRDELYNVLNEYEDDYYQALERHIGKHIKLLES